MLLQLNVFCFCDAFFITFTRKRYLFYTVLTGNVKGTSYFKSSIFSVSGTTFVSSSKIILVREFQFEDSCHKSLYPNFASVEKELSKCTEADLTVFGTVS